MIKRIILDGICEVWRLLHAVSPSCLEEEVLWQTDGVKVNRD